MMASRILLLVLLGCGIACYGRSLNDKCTLMPNPGPQVGHTMTVETNRDCEKGSVWWNYPQGTLVVRFSQTNPSAIFRLCILAKDSYFYFDDIRNDRTGNTVVKPTGESETCVGSEDGAVILRFHAARSMYYMALVNYRITQA